MMLGYILPASAIVHHSPNEGKRGFKAQGDLKRRGTVAGWPDLEILFKGRVLFVELKRPGEKPSDIQRGVHDRLSKAWFTTIVEHDVENLRKAVAEWIECVEAG